MEVGLSFLVIHQSKQLLNYLQVISLPSKVTQFKKLNFTEKRKTIFQLQKIID